MSRNLVKGCSVTLNSLEKVITAACSSKAVKLQHKEILCIEQPTQCMRSMRPSEHESPPQRNESLVQVITPTMQKQGERQCCKWYGSVRNHTKAQCPTANKTCNHYGKKGHYASVCLSKPKGETLCFQERLSCLEELHLGEVKVGPTRGT